MRFIVGREYMAMDEKAKTSCDVGNPRTTVCVCD